MDVNKITEYLKEEEYAALSWGGRLFKFHSRIHTTKEISLISKKSFDPGHGEKVFRTNQFGMVMFISVCLLMLVFLLKELILPKSKMGIEFYIFSTPLILLLVWVILITQNKKFNYKIILNTAGIEIRKTKYFWKDINETFIIERYGHSQGGTITFLILAFQNGVIERFDITNFSGFKEIHHDLANYIEHYRHNT